MLEELFDNSEFLAKLVAGRVPDNRRSCRAVHLTDLVDPTPWLRGGELILTTGMSLVDASAEVQADFVGKLAAAGCYALGYSGVDRRPPPAAMIEAADRHGLPLFVLDYDVPLSDVTMFVTSRILDRHYVRMRHGIEVHRRILREVARGTDLDTMLKIAVAGVPGTALVVFDWFGDVVAQHARTFRPLKTAELSVCRATPTVPGVYRDLTIDGELSRVWTLALDGEADGFFAATGIEGLDETDILILEHVRAGVVLVMAKQLSARQERRTLASEFIAAVMTGSLSHSEFRDRIRRSGLDPEAQLRVLAVPHIRSVPVPEACRIVEDVMGSPSLVGSIDNYVCAVSSADGASAQELHQALARTVGKLRVGVCAARRGPLGLKSAIHQAVSAARFATRDSGVVGLEDVPVAAMFGAEHPELRSIVMNRTLGPLLEADKRESSQLVASLSSFVKHGCRPGPAAAELLIHRHTLAYRLDKIAKLTGRDPRVGENLLEYTLALSLHSTQR